MRVERHVRATRERQREAGVDRDDRLRTVDPVKWILAAQRGQGNASVTRLLQSGRRPLQRKLFATGDVPGFRAIAEPAAAVRMEHQPDTGEVRATPAQEGPVSLHFQALLLRIIRDPARHAEMHFGVDMPEVTIGAFPAGGDLVAARVQRVDLNDIRALEHGAPGSGIATLAHEIQENYSAHAFQPVPGVNRYEPSHAMGIEAENLVSQDVAGPGGRVAERNAPGPAPGSYLLVADFEHYYLVVTLAGRAGEPHVTDARRAERARLGVHTVAGFAPGSAALPGAAVDVLRQVAAMLDGHPHATARIEGHGDPGPAGASLGRRRAEAVKDVLGAQPGAAAEALHAVASRNDGAPASVTITVTEPAP